MLRLITLLLSLSFVGCLPAHLQKYRKDNAGRMDPGADVGSGSPMPSGNAGPSFGKTAEVSNSRTQNAAPRATIYALDKKTFRFSLKEEMVWNTSLDVLMRNYNLTIVDRKSGIITTEWDSYFLNNSVYRNKVSIRMARSSWNSVDITIHNNVEKLRDASQAAGAVGAVWLPADDEANEVNRLVQNMALLLGQPPPIMPPGSGMAATGEISEKR